MMRSKNKLHTLALVFASAACLTLGASAQDRSQHHEAVTPFIGPVAQPDVVGGYSSTEIIVQVREQTQPVVLDDGRLSFRHAGLAPMVSQMIESDLADALERWRVASIQPTLPFEPANPERAAALGLDRYYTITVPEQTDTPGMRQSLARFPTHIERAEMIGIGGILTIPNDPSFNNQYGLHNTGQTIQGTPGVPGADISAVAAWELHTGTNDMTVAIVDTGIATNHPDLAPKLVTGYNPINGSSNIQDSVWIPHGTHVAGIAAAATNNGTGIAGVSWGANLMGIKALNDFGGGSEVDIANGVIWAADNGAQVINMSLGVPDGISFFENACQYAFDEGALIIAASGNTPGALIPPPARWPTVMAVGATNNQDNLASFTTTGPEMSVTAPGDVVYSTWLTFLIGSPTYTYQSGTSMASPHVAGLAALIWSANLDLTNEEIWQIIEETADDKGTPGWNPQFGHGRVNAHAALLAVLDVDTCGPPADLNCDGEVDIEDLFILLGEWGDCPDPADCPADLDGNGTVDIEDLFILLSAWT